MVFVGENPYSWPLWYLLALIISTIILRFLLFYKISTHNIFLIGLTLTLLGLVINHFINLKTNTFIDSILNIYKLIFVTTRNGFFVGFGYISTGFIIAYYEDRLYKYLNWEYLILIVSYILCLYKIPFALNVSSTMLFIILVQKNIYNGTNNLWLRNMSTIIYFFHMYFIFAFMLFSKLTHIQLPFIYTYIIIIIVITAFSALILKLSKIKRFSFLKNLLG